MRERPDYYEQVPDGHQWPGTLKGLLQAMDDCAMASARDSCEYQLTAVRGVSTEVIRVYENGVQA